MRLYLSIFFITLFAVGLSAGNNRTLKWISKASSGEIIPDFEGSVHPDNQSMPVYSETQVPESHANDYHARLIYPIFQKLKPEEVRSLKASLKNLSDSILVKISLGMQRKKQVIDLSFCPFIKKGTTYYKLVSFAWDIKPIHSGLRSVSTLKTLVASSSKLSSGKWKKISVTETGIFKLTYSDIIGMGINPQNVQIYGYGGALLDEDFSLGGYLDDLPEVTVWKELGSDGVFNQGDFILFFAQGPVSWKYNHTESVFERTRNHYSDKAFYFVGERLAGTKTVSMSTFSGASTVDVKSFTDVLLHEVDRVNIGESVANSGTGRQLYGEDFTINPVQTFKFEVPNPDTTQFARAEVEFIAKSSGASICRVDVNNVGSGATSIEGVLDSDEYTYANSSHTLVSFKSVNSSIAVRIDYQQGGYSVKHRAYLDYIALNVPRFLKMTGSSLLFRDPQSVGPNQVGHFTIQNAGQRTVVFDVTNPQDMVEENGKPVGTDYSFNASTSSLREYACVNLSGTFPKPTIEGNVTNQDIHAKSGVDMVILSSPEYVPYANQLAQAHARYDNLSVLVVTPEQVYNEFSSGTPDATAYRRMMKHFYDKATSDNELPHYLLLFGDGVYDNRQISTMFSKNTSKSGKLLTYQSVESLDGNNSFVTDDYFGFLDDNEGLNLSADMLDIGIGRFPVSSVEQAKVAVDKTLAYMSNARKGVWKNSLLYLADDGNDYIHEIQADALASSVELSNPEFMIHKIYVDGYPKVTTVSGVTVPDANKRFSELLNSGLLMINYTGHGSTSQWADEKLLTVPEIKNMTNNCLPLWVTATCDFTRFDASETSGGEWVFLNPNGGGIGLFTTTRIVYSWSNHLLNKSFMSNIFAKENGSILTLGEIMNRSKCDQSLKGNRNKLSFTLIGDPALKLVYPQYSAQVTQINGQNVSAVMDTLSALSRVTVSGKIYTSDGQFADKYNGVVCPTVLDAEDVLMTCVDLDVPTTFYNRSKVLFSGRDSIINGNFSFTFVVPKDIRYSAKTGSINLYAFENGGNKEAQGFYQNFLLSGTATSTNLDRTGPEIKLSLNSEDFISGGLSNETPTLLARISDENGLNTSGNGIGHDLVLIIDGSSSMTYNLNNNYTSNIGSYTSGLVQYVLPKLSAGKHRLSFKAWDVLNNSSVDTLWFEVKPGMKPSVSDLQFVQQGNTSFFLFSHDRPGVRVDIKLYVYDLKGRMIWSSVWNMQANDLLSDRLEWNLTDVNGRRIPGGIYTCQVVLTDSGGSQTHAIKKILVSGQ